MLFILGKLILDKLEPLERPPANGLSPLTNAPEGLGTGMELVDDSISGDILRSIVILLAEVHQELERTTSSDHREHAGQGEDGPG